MLQTYIHFVKFKIRIIELNNSCLNYNRKNSLFQIKLITKDTWQSIERDVVDTDTSVASEQPQQPQQVQSLQHQQITPQDYTTQADSSPQSLLTSMAGSSYTLSLYPQTVQVQPAYISLKQHILTVKEGEFASQSSASGMDVDVQLTPVTQRPRKTHPGCSTIKYNRPSNPDLSKRRIHFCTFLGYYYIESYVATMTLIITFLTYSKL